MLERRPDLTAGVTFPAGTATTVYAGGFVWGGVVHDSGSPLIRVGGQTYTIGTTPGRILRPGLAENPANADVRIYRIRRDWATADLRQDAATVYGKDPSRVTQADIDAVRSQYRQDWIGWPWEQGAPYYNRDGKPGYQPDPNGRVDSATDEPGLAGADQVIWLVANDLDSTVTDQLYGSPSIGLEMQITCWAYAGKPQFSNVIFQRCRLIYKGLTTTPSNSWIDSLYIAKWVDPDVGDYSDDYAGCAPARNLGFAYNSEPQDGSYANFGLTPPVVGYDFLEGPGVAQAGGKGHFDLQTVSGIANLPMTSFTYFTIGTRTTDLNFASYSDTKAWWNILRGFKASPVSPPRCMTDPLTGLCTEYELDGDPVNYTGWLDGRVDPTGDRRFLMSSGPARLALGDTQEVIVALIGAMGSNNRTGVTVLDTIADNARDFYNIDFHTLDSIPVPDLRIVELHDTLMLDWERDTAQMSRIENFSAYGYRFESYRIYQLSSPAADRSTAYTFQPIDLYTSPRFLTVNHDYLRNQPIVDGTQYYYAVTAVMSNPDPAFAIPRIESPLVVHTATPHQPDPGTVFPYGIGSTIGGVSDYAGLNDAVVTASYYDPTAPLNHVYEIVFHNDNFLDEKAKWDLYDTTTHDTLLSGSHVDDPARRVVTRGMNVQVAGVPFYLKDVVDILPANPPKKVNVFNAPDPSGTFMIVSGGTSVLDTLKSAATSDDDVELRFGRDSSWAVFVGPTAKSCRWIKVPYTAWWLKRQGKDTTFLQQYTIISDFGADSVWRATTYLSQQYQGRDIKVFYPLTIMIGEFPLSQTVILPGPYDPNINADSNSFLVKAFIWENAGMRGRYTAIWKAYVADLDTNNIAAPPGTVVRFERYHRINDHDIKIFQPRSVVVNNFAAAADAVKAVNVFPNPYYGFNNRETSVSGKFITFSHLPYRATIRIFNLAGALVRTLTRATEQQYTTWDLNNETGLPVASGIYLAYIDMADVRGASLGTKTLKLMIVREAQLFK